MPTKPQPAKRKEPKRLVPSADQSCSFDFTWDSDGRLFLSVRDDEGSHAAVYLNSVDRRKLAALLAEPNTKRKGK